MKVLIIEDEAPIAQSLVKMIQGLRPEAEIVGITTDIPGSRAAIAAHPDLELILSDIKIDDGMSFSVFDRIRTEAAVVFTTAYDEYALKAFDYNCIDYLLKPISREALERALSRCEKHFPRADTGTIRNVSEQITRKAADFRKRFFLQRGQETLICDVSEIGYIYSEKGITRVFLTDGKWGDLGCSLLEFSQGLQADLFVRVSRQAIVHVGFVGAIAPGPGRDSTVTLKKPFEGISFVITQERKKALLIALNGNV